MMEYVIYAVIGIASLAAAIGLILAANREPDMTRDGWREYVDNLRDKARR